MNNGNSGGATNAMKAAIQFAKALASAIAGNLLEAISSVAQSSAGKYVICFVLVVALILTSLVPALIGSLVGVLIETASDVIDFVGDAFGWVGDLFGGLIGGEHSSLEERTDIGFMQHALAGTQWAVDTPEVVNVEDLTFTEAVNAVTSTSGNVIDAYIAQRCGDYVALADSIASSYSTKNVNYNGVTYPTCNTSVKVNTLTVPANTGKKIMCAYIAQTLHYLYALRRQYTPIAGAWPPHCLRAGYSRFRWAVTSKCQAIYMDAAVHPGYSVWHRNRGHRCRGNRCNHSAPQEEKAQ